MHRYLHIDTSGRSAAGVPPVEGDRPSPTQRWLFSSMLPTLLHFAFFTPLVSLLNVLAATKLQGCAAALMNALMPVAGVAMLVPWHVLHKLPPSHRRLAYRGLLMAIVVASDQMLST